MSKSLSLIGSIFGTMRIFLLFVFLNPFTFSLRSQTPLQIGDTIFFDKNWKPGKKKNNGYYRVVSFVKGHYLVKDFYMNDTLQMASEALSYEPLVRQGVSTYYFANGKKQSSGSYRDGKKTGQWTFWDAKGKMTQSIDYDQPGALPYDSVSWAPQNQSSLFLINANYRFRANRGFLNSGHGFGLEVGINLGYFISQRWLLGVFGGWATRDILYNTKFDSKFLRDLNAASTIQNLRGNDSLVAASTFDYMTNGRGYFHDRTMYAGLMIRLPYKYAPILKIYKGYSSYECKTSNKLNLQPYNEDETGYDRDYYDLVRKMDWGLEVFLFSGRSRVREYDSEGLIHRWNKNFRWNRNLVGFSFYVERYDWKSASLSFAGNQSLTIPLSQMVNPDFFHHYKKEYVMGFRLSVGIF